LRRARHSRVSTAAVETIELAADLFRREAAEHLHHERLAIRVG
jgi:hypothetical protein